MSKVSMAIRHFHTSYNAQYKGPVYSLLSLCTKPQTGRKGKGREGKEREGKERKKYGGNFSIPHGHMSEQTGKTVPLIS